MRRDDRFRIFDARQKGGLASLSGGDCFEVFLI